jgi:hypothetical protein
MDRAWMLTCVELHVGAGVPQMQAPEEAQGRGSDLKAGWFAGLAQTAVGQPFDRVKVNVQAEGFGSSLGTFKRIISTEGPLSLYRGSLAPALAGGLAVSLQFALWEQAFVQGNGEFVSGALSGAFSSPLICAIERIKIAQQLGRANALKGLFRGFPLVLARDSLGLGVYYSAFSQLESQTGAFGAGAVAGVAYWIAVFLIDGWKTRVQADLGVSYRKAFGRPSYAGIGACLVRAVPVNAATFFVYRQFKGAE